MEDTFTYKEIDQILSLLALGIWLECEANQKRFHLEHDIMDIMDHITLCPYDLKVGRKKQLSDCSYLIGSHFMKVFVIFDN